MDIRIETERGDPGELDSLLQQLEKDPALRGQARIVPVAPKTALGAAALIALEIAVSGSPVPVPLVAALTTWLRRRKARIAVEITAADGRQVTITSQQRDDVVSWQRYSSGQTVARVTLHDLGLYQLSALADLLGLDRTPLS